MPLVLFNTLHRKKEEFISLKKGQVDFYSCGPTVYNSIHIGNLRAFLFADTLYRWLQHGLSFQVRWVMNITDVDDKTIRGSLTETEQDPTLTPLAALQKFTRYYEAIFFADLEQVNISRNSFFRTPRATESIEPMQELIRLIAKNGYAYEQDGSIYFSIPKYVQKEHYGKLLALDLDALKTGTRTLADEIEKENVQDFVLWKGQKPHEPTWDFNFLGKNLPGRPGWHIECSAMEKEAFGELPFDIHSGGVDLTFPHHEDEIAQSVAGYGSEPTHYWVHNEHLLVDGKKMSKSLGNFYTLADLVAKGFSAETVRFFLVSNHYRTKLNLTFSALEAAHTTLQNIRNQLALFAKKTATPTPHETAYVAEFVAAMNDDLNAPQALAGLFAALEDQANSAQAITALFQFAEKVFGVRFFPVAASIPQAIQDLAVERQAAKKNKDFVRADTLRATIAAQGFTLRDTATGYEILPQEL